MSGPCRFGKCIDSSGGFICQCDEGYEGTTCDRGTYMYIRVYRPITLPNVILLTLINIPRCDDLQ